MTDKLSDAWQCQSCGCYFPHIPKILDNDVKRCSKCVEVEVLELERDRFVKANAEVARLNADLAVANIDLEQRVEGLEEAEIRIGADDEYVHGPLFHMERMHEGHIWFRIGDEAFDLYASDGTRLTWVPQTSGGWDALAAEIKSDISVAASDDSEKSDR